MKMNFQIICKAANFIKTSLKRVFYFDQNDYNYAKKVSVFSNNEIQKCFMILDDPVVQSFLEFDCRYILADNYLIAMAFMYLIRSHLPFKFFDAAHFFSALYLAHEMDDDIETLKQFIIPWFPFVEGNTDKKFEQLYCIKTLIWKNLDFNCFVSKESCDRLMMYPAPQDVWNRKRNAEHFTINDSNKFLIRNCMHNNGNSKSNGYTLCWLCLILNVKNDNSETEYGMSDWESDTNSKDENEDVL